MNSSAQFSSVRPPRAKSDIAKETCAGPPRISIAPCTRLRPARSRHARALRKLQHVPLPYMATLIWQAAHLLLTRHWLLPDMTTFAFKRYELQAWPRTGLSTASGRAWSMTCSKNHSPVIGCRAAAGLYGAALALYHIGGRAMRLQRTLLAGRTLAEIVCLADTHSCARPH